MERQDAFCSPAQSVHFCFRSAPKPSLAEPTACRWWIPGSTSSADSAKRLASTALGGAFVESFVLDELTRHAASIDEALTFSHFRDHARIEVDIVIERPDGGVIAIEVKSARSVSGADARGE